MTGLDAGADDYLTKPVVHQALMARVRSMLRIKALHDLAETQRRELALWNEMLERRAEITVLFSDLRGFTAFAEAQPTAEVMAALAAYHCMAGPLIQQRDGTLERSLGDGIVVLFNDPVPCSDPERRAVRMALALRDGFGRTQACWRMGTGKETGRIGIGIGIAHWPTTVGPIGFRGRLDYAAISDVPNFAARLSASADDGQILIDAATAARVADSAVLVPLGHLALKGFTAPRQVVEVSGMP